MEREFEITIEETLIRKETIRANSKEEAIGIAMERYYSCEIVLGADDFQKVEFDGTEKQLEKERIPRMRGR